MPVVKTAISLEKDLFDQVNKLANEIKVSRSRIFTLAIKEYLKKYENKRLLLQLNEAYDDFPDDTETRIIESMRKKQRRAIRLLIEPREL